MNDDMLIWYQLTTLQHRYIATLDNDRLEEWPQYFTENCLYEIVPRENEDAGLPVGIIHCNSQRMLRDRVVSLRHANIFEAHSYRHMVSGLSIVNRTDTCIDTESSYVVVQTRTDGESNVYQAGRYLDRVVRQGGEWRYAKKRVIYDTSRVQTLLATPI